MAAHINTLLQNLNNGSDLLSTLEGIKVVLNTTHPSELKELLKNVSFDPVFSCLNSTNRSELELSRDILTILLDNVDVEVMLAQFRDELCMGLGHPQEDIRALCLKQISSQDAPESIDMFEEEKKIKRAATEPTGLDVLLSDADLLSLVISKVGDDSLAVAKIAMVILKVVGSEIKGQGLLFGGQHLANLKSVEGRNDTVRYRVFEIVVNIAASSPSSLEKIVSSGFLQDLISDINTDDILIQLNAIEMLANLSISQHALHFLEQQGVMGRLENLLIGAQADASQDFLIGPIIKFFGTVAHFDPKEVTEKHTSFLKITFDLLLSDDPALACIAVETVGFIGRTVEGKQTLDKQGQSMLDALKQIGRLLVQPPTEMRTRALVSMQDLFTLQEEHHTDDLLCMEERWFMHLSSKPLDLLLSLCKQPFTEIRCNALLILRALVNQPWAAFKLNQEAGFLEYILDRATEPDKEGKETKYSVVKALAEASSTAEIFGAPSLLKLKEYVREGPFYVRVQSEVAMESGS